MTPNSLTSNLSPADANTLEAIKAINARAYAMRFNKAAEAQAILAEAFERIASLPEKDPQVTDLMAELHVTAGGLCYGTSEYEAGVSNLYEAYHLFERVGNEDGLARACNLLGVIHQPLGNFGEALEYFIQAHNITSQGDETANFNIAVLGNLGFIHLEMNLNDEAKYYLETAYGLAQKNEKNFGMGDILDNLCKLHARLGDYPKALAYGEESLATFARFDHSRGMADSSNSIATIYQLMGDLDQALEYHQRALQITRDLNHRYEEIESLRYIASIHGQRGDKQKAHVLIQEALEAAERINAPQLTYRCHRDLANIYKESGEFDKALASFENFHRLKEQLFDRDAERRIRVIALIQQLKETRQHAEDLRRQNKALEREIDARKSLQSQLEYIAARDPLTDLLNRRAFFSQIERIAAANHGQRVLAAILLDIDNFKRINDGHGHLTGDQALKRVAENIQGNIRRGDLACRFGGDEFAVFITTKSGEEAKHFAERLRASFNADPIPMGADQVPIRASFGVALHFEGDFNIEALLEQADQALYSAKADGKDRIKIFSN